VTLLKKGRKTEFFMVNHSGHCATFSQKLGFFSGLIRGQESVAGERLLHRKGAKNAKKNHRIFFLCFVTTNALWRSQAFATCWPILLQKKAWLLA
jgi:hypothetical protein